MAIALLKAGAVATGTTSLTPAFGQSTTAGNFLSCQLTSTNSTLITISGTPSTWLQAVPASGFTSLVFVFYRADCGAGESVPTFTANSGDALTAVLAEWTGVATTSPLDQSGIGSRSGNSVVITNSAADTTALDLCLAAIIYFNSKNATATFSSVWKPPSLGFPGGTNGNTGGTKTANWSYFPYGIYTAGGGSADTVTSTASPSSGSVSSGDGVMASFIPAGAAVEYLPPAPRSFVPQMRASTWFSRVPWHEKKPGGFLIPSDAERRLVVAGA